MSKLLIIAKLLLSMGIPVISMAQGTAAYYNSGTMKEVCLNRVDNNWNPLLNCSFPCLISAIEQHHIGEYWLIALPNCNNHELLLRLCHVVDVGAEEDLPKLRDQNEVAEISNRLAQYCGYKDYVEGVMVWRLGGYNELDQEAD